MYIHRYTHTQIFLRTYIHTGTFKHSAEYPIHTHTYTHTHKYTLEHSAEYPIHTHTHTHTYTLEHNAERVQAGRVLEYYNYQFISTYLQKAETVL